MTQHYTDPERENETYSLPDLEVWEDKIAIIHCRCGDTEVHSEYVYAEEDNVTCPSCARRLLSPVAYTITKRAGWFYWACFPGCMPDSDAMGPFKTEQAALDDAREYAGVYDE